MARSRNIKPSFFINEELVELPFSTRLLFIGLWTIADREGRLEDKPKRIKMALFPADDLDVNLALNELDSAGFIQRYEVDAVQYIQILAFKKHQNPHIKEPASTIPAPDLHQTRTVRATLIPDSLLPIADSLQKHVRPSASLFDSFWSAYPRKEAKEKARAAFLKAKIDLLTLDLILDALSWQKDTEQWRKNIIPHASTYINQKRWLDEKPTDGLDDWLPAERVEKDITHG